MFCVRLVSVKDWKIVNIQIVHWEIILNIVIQILLNMHVYKQTQFLHLILLHMRKHKTNFLYPFEKQLNGNIINNFSSWNRNVWHRSFNGNILYSWRGKKEAISGTWSLWNVAKMTKKSNKLGSENSCTAVPPRWPY